MTAIYASYYYSSTEELGAEDAVASEEEAFIGEHLTPFEW